MGGRVFRNMASFGAETPATGSKNIGKKPTPAQLTLGRGSQSQQDS